jgi:hypothetical protein
MGYRVVAQPGSKAVEKMLMDRAEVKPSGPPVEWQPERDPVLAD